MKATIQGLEISNSKWGPLVGLCLRYTSDGDLYKDVKEALANGNKVFLTKDARVKKAYEIIAALV